MGSGVRSSTHRKLGTAATTKRLCNTHRREMLWWCGRGRWVQVGRWVETGGVVYPQGGCITMVTRERLGRGWVHCLQRWLLVEGGHCMECRGNCLQGGWLIRRREGYRAGVSGDVVVQLCGEGWGLVCEGGIVQ